MLVHFYRVYLESPCYEDYTWHVSKALTYRHVKKGKSNSISLISGSKGPYKGHKVKHHGTISKVQSQSLNQIIWKEELRSL